MDAKLSATDIIRLLEPGESYLFRGSSPASIRAIVSRVKAEFKGKRNFHTEKTGAGVKVWALA